MIGVRAVAWDDPVGAALRLAQQTEVSARYGVDDSEPGVKPSADDIAVFLVAFDGDTAVGCGALRELDPTHGEVKRMYVAPDRRGSGVSTALLRRLESEARMRGWDRLLLETGTEQPDARRFYEREGFTAIPNYGHYVGSPTSRCYAKSLQPDDPALAGLTFARAVDADAPELLVLQRACWVAEALANERLDIPALHESLDDVRHGVAVQQTWVVREGPRLVGSVRGRIHGDAWEIGRLMVAPDLAGRGLGRFLLAFIQEQAPAEVDRLELFTGARSERNLRIYTTAGFTLDGSVNGVAHLSKPRESSDPVAG